MKLQDKVASITGVLGDMGREFASAIAREVAEKMPPLLGVACHLIYGGKMNAAL